MRLGWDSQRTANLIQHAGWGGGQPGMGKPYSIDLRERALGAVVRGGLSCNRVAGQFGLGVSTVIHWVRGFRGAGSGAPSKVGGYRAKGIRGEQRVWLFGRG